MEYLERIENKLDKMTDALVDIRGQMSEIVIDQQMRCSDHTKDLNVRLDARPKTKTLLTVFGMIFALFVTVSGGLLKYTNSLENAFLDSQKHIELKIQALEKK